MSTDRIRCLVLLGNLSGGGGERTVLNLLRHIDRRRFAIRLGLLRLEGAYADQVDPEDLALSTLSERFPWLADERADAARGPLDLVRRVGQVPVWILKIREIVERERPDVVLSLMTGLNVMVGIALATVRRPVTWIAREGNNLGASLRELFPHPLLRAPARHLIRRSHLAADCGLTISRGMARGLSETLGLPVSRFHVIYNPIDIALIRRRATAPVSALVPQPYIVAAGRLQQQKGFDLLIEALARSRARRETHLLILGEGLQRERLQALAGNLGVADRVCLPGFVSNPWAYMARARLFVHPSRWEGFGHVVAEAMACEAPVIVTDCDFGPREIVREGRSGIVVPAENPEALAAAIDRLHENETLRHALIAGGIERIRDFDAPHIVAQYEALLRQQVDSRRHAPATRAAHRVP